jgi:hypothetical protein
MSSVETTPIGLVEWGSTTIRCESSRSTMSSAAIASSSLLATIRTGVAVIVRAAWFVEVARLGRAHEVGVGDHTPEAAAGQLFLPVRGDQDRVHALGRHHPRHGSKGRIERARDQTRVHRVENADTRERRIRHRWIED